METTLPTQPTISFTSNKELINKAADNESAFYILSWNTKEAPHLKEILQQYIPTLPSEAPFTSSLKIELSKTEVCQLQSCKQLISQDNASLRVRCTALGKLFHDALKSPLTHTDAYDYLYQLQELAKNNAIDAVHTLGDIYANPKATGFLDINPATGYNQAKAYFEEAASLGSQRSRAALGHLYYAWHKQLNISKEEGIKKAYACFSDAKEHPDARFMLATLYKEHWHLLPEDSQLSSLELIEQHHKKNAEEGLIASMHELASLYFELGKKHPDFPTGIKEYYQKAESYLKEAAALGHVDSMLYLADKYLNGYDLFSFGLEYSAIRAAAELLQKAGELGSPNAYYALGVICEKNWEAFLNEEGVKIIPNLDNESIREQTALDYYKKAAQMGFTQAQEACNRLDSSTSKNKESESDSKANDI